jgi:diaminopimelate epimerase
MNISFSKYHGAGNDFIIIDNRENQLPPDSETIKKLCHRQLGIGADGLMLLENDVDHDFRMRYFNSDGNEATMCGNGGRCIVMFANKLGMIGDQTSFNGVDGLHHATIVDKETVNLGMKGVDAIEQEEDYYLLNTGSPHCVSFVENIDRIDVNTEGRFIRNSIKPNSGGVNVNFVQITSEGIRVRTYERGVESETLSCGTGSVAAAIATEYWLEEGKNEYTIFTKGGTLYVSFEKTGKNSYSNIWLKGPVKHVFDGIYIM